MTQDFRDRLKPVLQRGPIPQLLATRSCRIVVPQVSLSKRPGIRNSSLVVADGRVGQLKTPENCARVKNLVRFFFPRAANDLDQAIRQILKVRFTIFGKSAHSVYREKATAPGSCAVSPSRLAARHAGRILARRWYMLTFARRSDGRCNTSDLLAGGWLEAWGTPSAILGIRRQLHHAWRDGRGTLPKSCNRLQ